MITIQELLKNRGLDFSQRIKLVRHKNVRRDLYQLYKTNKSEFLAYQNSQHRDVFKNVDLIVSFIGEDGVMARFIGVFKIVGKQEIDQHFEYSMIEEEVQFQDLKERVIIKWSNPIAWQQWIKNEMEVVEIGYSGDVDPLPGILTPLKMTGLFEKAIY